VRLTVQAERWPIAGAFTIARGSKTEAHVVVAQISADGHAGRGEAVPYGRYGETVDGVLAQIEGLPTTFDRAALQTLLPPGAARNAVDCALWDLEAKRTGRPAWSQAGLDPPGPVTTCYTLSLASPQAMAIAARAQAHRPLLKLKIGGPDDLACVEAVRAAAPDSGLVVDANEGLTFDDLRRLAPDFARLGVRLIEQPLPANQDQALQGYISPVLLCADESLHSRAELDAVAGRYGGINIKLDKAGGLTEALALSREARARGLAIMVGCMVATSLAMAPAMLLAQDAAIVDLDGALLLARDRDPGLVAEGSVLHPPVAALWG
jgi:L-alanine-DL-glutamate epimerase-like enolase superfamily enzyme